MIDYLALILLFAAALHRAVSCFSPARRLGALIVAAFLFHGLSAGWLHFRAPPEVAHVITGSASFRAGLRAGARVSSIDATPISHWSDLLWQALGTERRVITTTHGEFRHDYAGHDRRWRFWEGVDGYDLEEALGGMVLWPRGPVAILQENQFDAQLSGIRSRPVYFIGVQGKKVRTADDVLDVLRANPAPGLVPARIAWARADKGEESLLMQSRSGFQGASHDGVSDLDRAWGFYGLPLHIQGGRHGWRFALVRMYETGYPEGPAWLAAQRALHPGGLHWAKLFTGEGIPLGSEELDVVAVPRPVLLPWTHDSLIVSATLGFFGTGMRQLLALGNLPALGRHWHGLPLTHYYVADHGARAAPAVLHRLSSASWSLFFGVLVALGLSRWWIGREAWAWALAVTLLLQFADFFKIHII